MSAQAQPSSALQRTPLHDRHVALGARLVDFGGWEMPVQYPTGIIAEHLATRSAAGLFDVSHMGRFTLRGPGTLPFLQHVLTGNAEALDLLQAQYTIVPTPTGGAVDDAYLYRFDEAEYLLVVNASNRIKDWEHFQSHLSGFPDVELSDETDGVAMLALQGKAARGILAGLIETGGLPEPFRNELSVATLRVPDPGGGAALAVETRIGRTGYTGEPLCFELFVAAEQGPALWDALLAAGAVPVGLGARDTLRLEAGLPLYGHELGLDPAGHEIPIMSCPLATFAVSFSPRKGEFVGREALARQHAAYARIISRDYSLIADLPRLTRPLAVTGRGIAREGAPVSRPGDGDVLGWVTSGTAVPYWGVEGEGLCSTQTEGHELRSIALTYIDSRVLEDDELEVDVRGKRVPALVVPYHLRSDAPPCARAIVWDHVPQLAELEGGETGEKALRLLAGAIDNHAWRQERCIDLIPSEMTTSPMARLLSIMDPAFRYAEHKKTEAFYDLEVFYYQGTGFIDEVERLLAGELRAYLGCPEVETRVISGQMANTAVFSALVDYLNRADRQAEPRRIGKVINNHIAKGGHLSAQPMGALRDYVARDPRTEMPAVVDIPVLAEQSLPADVPALLDLIERERPELDHPRQEHGAPPRAGVRGPHIPRRRRHRRRAHVRHGARPRPRGAALPGALQRGRRHRHRLHPQDVLRHAARPHRRALAGARAEVGPLGDHRAAHLPGLREQPPPRQPVGPAHGGLRDEPLQGRLPARRDRATPRPSPWPSRRPASSVAGDPAVDYTETHQVIVDVGYGRGAELAGRLEDNNIICNYQAAPDEEGFTASGALRLGVAEMTRFGMAPADFAEVAALMAAVVNDDRNVAADVAALRARFTELGYCFEGPDFDPLVQRLHELV